MPRKLPPNVDRVGKYLYFRIGKGARTRLPDYPTSQEFRDAYTAAIAGTTDTGRRQVRTDKDGSIGALIASYKASTKFRNLKGSSPSGYSRRLEQIREDHGHRTVAGLTKDRVDSFILAPLADRPGAQLDTLKKLRILIAHAIDKKWLASDPSHGIKRPKSKEFRAWTNRELAAFEQRWPIGTKQRTAYALMLYLGTARADTHRITWRQLQDGVAEYERKKTGVPVEINIDGEFAKALAAASRKNVTVINTEYGKPFSVDGFSQFMRDAMTAAGLPLGCKPHGLRKTLGRRLADSGCTAHEIMAVLGHTTLAEAERYTREANRRHGARNAIRKLADYTGNRAPPQTASESLGNVAKKEEKSG